MALPVLTRSSRIMVVTGAGISAESGISTFRDAGGLWEQYRLEDVATPQGFMADPALVWDFYQQRRRHVLLAQPNAAHRALVALEQYVGAHNFLLVTQNIDGLHRRAGSQSPVEIHGSLYTDRCTQCAYRNDDGELYDSLPPACPVCGGLLRPDVVWFGEALSPKHLSQAFLGLSMADLFIAVGTSGSVYPVSLFVYETNAPCVYVGMEQPENADGFDELRLGPAGAALPALLHDLTAGELPSTL